MIEQATPHPLDAVAPRASRALLALIAIQIAVNVALLFTSAFVLQQALTITTWCAGIALVAWVYFVHVRLRGSVVFAPFTAVIISVIPAIGLVGFPYAIFDALRVSRGAGRGAGVLVGAWWLLFLFSMYLGSINGGLRPSSGALSFGAIAYALLGLVVWKVWARDRPPE